LDTRKEKNIFRYPNITNDNHLITKSQWV